MKSLFKVANFVTLSRILLLVPYTIVFLRQDWLSIAISLLIFVLAGITDFLDGFLARLLNETSEFGRLFDPLADKILITSVLIIQLVVDSTIYPVWVVLILIIRDFTISDFRLFSIEKQKPFSTAFLAKMKTAFLFITITVSQTLMLIESYYKANNLGSFKGLLNDMLPNLGFLVSILPTILICIATYFSIHSGVAYLYTNRGIFSDNSNANTKG